MKTNTENITHIMEFSKHGALMQIFIIDALNKHSDLVIHNEKQLKKSMADSFISPEAWVGCAKELKAYLSEAYLSKN